MIEKHYKGNLNWLPARTIFYTRHGSHAYGTNIETSDEDFKGVAIPPRDYFVGFMKVFEQAESKEPDSVVYDIRKFFRLACDNNPSIIEVLFTDPSDHLICTAAGQKLLENRQKFLHRGAKHRFAGYAISQLRRIQTHRRWLLNPVISYPTRAEMGLPERTVIPANQLEAAQAAIQKELDRWNLNDMEGVSEEARIVLKQSMADLLADIKVHSDNLWIAAARKAGHQDNFIELLDKERRYEARKREYDQYQTWKKTRNRARAELEGKFLYDTKNAMQLVRLLISAEEILIKGTLTVKRQDREFLLSIRNGAWTYEQLIKWAEKQEERLDKLYKECTILPNTCDRKFLNELCIELVKGML